MAKFSHILETKNKRAMRTLFSHIQDQASFKKNYQVGMVFGLKIIKV